MFIWRDIDPNNFIIGVKTKTGYASWGCVFIDGLSEMFGPDVYEIMKNSNPGEPIEFKINAEKETT